MIDQGFDTACEPFFPFTASNASLVRSMGSSGIDAGSASLVSFSIGPGRSPWLGHVELQGNLREGLLRLVVEGRQ